MDHTRKAVMWDWDGTLADNVLILHERSREIFRKFGDVEDAPKEPIDFIREIEETGNYPEVYYNRGVTIDRDTLHEAFTEMYRDELCAVRLSKNALETLAILKGEGAKHFLVTSQMEMLVTPLLECFGIKKVFSDLRFHEINKRAAIKALLAEHGLTPEHTYYVGDQPSDVRHANEAGIRSVAYYSPHFPREEMHKMFNRANPDHEIFDLGELVNIVRDETHKCKYCE